jgi:hypothetical protein
MKLVERDQASGDQRLTDRVLPAESGNRESVVVACSTASGLTLNVVCHDSQSLNVICSAIAVV